MITIDFETRSRVDLKKCGASVYARHESTEILCLAYAFGPEAVRIWKPGDPKPEALLDAVAWGVEEIEAHNVFFERNIWRWICHERFGWPDVKAEAWRCSMAACCRLTFPRSLGDAGEAIGTIQKKDDGGHKIMMRLSKPKKPSKADPSEWDNDPQKFHRLYAYCKQDVVAEREISRKIEPLTPSELKVWQLDQKINLRGLAVDVPAIKNALAIVDQTYLDCCESISELTSGEINSPKQVAAIGKWIEDRMGERPAKLDAETVAAWLERDDLPKAVNVILQLRQMASKASTAKLKSMLQRCDEDGRVRGNLVYHGATTGRWAGSGIQIQNYPRGTLSADEIDLVHRLLPSFGGRALDLLLGPPIDCISSSLRSMVRAGEGNRLLVCDFASIEARVLAWLACEEELLSTFATGGDVYKSMASKIYDVDEDEVTKTQRHVGKTAILGCFEADTKVLTDRGWVAIVDVSETDFLWDGEEWVRHSGVIYQGRKSVLRRIGVGATPDHLCLTTSGWSPWVHVATNHQSIERAIGLVNLPFEGFGRLPTKAERKEGTSTKPNALAEVFNASTEKTLTQEGQPVATIAPRSQQDQRGFGNTSQAWMTTDTERGCSTDFLRRSVDATTSQARHMKGTAGGVSKSANDGEYHDPVSSSTSKPVTGGITRIWKWIVSTITKATNQETSDSFQGSKTWPTEDRLTNYNAESSSLKLKSRVYDIANAGPRNRFTILTEAGPLIVHNCGYGMGAKAFVGTCQRMAGITIDLAMSKQVIKAYRDTNSEIRDLWGSVQTACIGAIETGKPHRVGKLEMTCENRWLKIKLPSGRQLHYRDPEITEVVAPWSQGYRGEIQGDIELQLTLENLGIELGERIGDYWADCDVPKGVNRILASNGIKAWLEKKEPKYIKQIQFMGVDSLSRKWTTQRTYGAKLVENIVQAVARDFLVEAMFRCEQARYEIVATVHDEIIAERRIGEGTLEEFESIMRAVPRWGRGCPIEVDGFESERYRK